MLEVSERDPGEREAEKAKQEEAELGEAIDVSHQYIAHSD